MSITKAQIGPAKNIYECCRLVLPRVCLLSILALWLSACGGNSDTVSIETMEDRLSGVMMNMRFRATEVEPIYLHYWGDKGAYSGSGMEAGNVQLFNGLPGGAYKNYAYEFHYARIGGHFFVAWDTGMNLGSPLDPDIISKWMIKHAEDLTVEVRVAIIKATRGSRIGHNAATNEKAKQILDGLKSIMDNDDTIMIVDVKTKTQWLVVSSFP